MNGKCLGAQEICPAKKRKSNLHHIWWPARDYQTPLEKAYRSLPENTIQLCVCEHDALHRNPPPEKPSIQQMILALTVEFQVEF